MRALCDTENDHFINWTCSSILLAPVTKPGLNQKALQVEKRSLNGLKDIEWTYLWNHYFFKIWIVFMFVMSFILPLS